jgi:hypothetical protein
MTSIRKATAAIAVTIAVLFSLSCKDSKMRAAKKSAALDESLPGDARSTLSRRTVYFGHQSVGANILDGIRDILKEDPATKWTILELEDARTAGTPALVHSWLGRNGLPVSKLDAFADVLRGSAPRRFDVALMKFCFVDFSEETDVQDLFRRYGETFAALKASCPGTTFVHVTVPLTGSPGGLKWIARNVVKRLVGRKVRGPRDNRTINEFNDLMRRTYLGHEPLFDLAAVESTRPDGSREMVREAGHDLYSLASAYTSDGGHLNERGRRIVAGELLAFLAALPEKG